jgi:HEAT repeat protein
MTTTTDDPLPDLIRALRSRIPADRLRAARDLGRLGWLARDALAALVTVVTDEDAKVREAAAHAIGQMGPEALPELIAMLAHEDKYVRRSTVWALAKLGPLARPALTDLCSTLRDPDPRTASGAAQAIGSMKTDGADGVPALAEAMRGTNIVLCRLAAKALSQVGPPALATLIAHLQHTDPFVRGESALALGWMGASARAAVPFLAQVVRGSRSRPLHDTPPPSSRATSRITDERSEVELSSGTATPPVLTTTTEAMPDETCRVYAAQALGRIGPAASAAVSDLRDATHHGPEPLRTAAQQALRLIQG